jgi:hypothetical protein
VKNIRNGLLLALAFCLLATVTAAAQADTLTLSLSRDWGYGGFGGDIQGTFSMRASGSAGVARVEFYIDETKIGEASKPPYNLQFVTDNYPLGAHALYAVGFTNEGVRVESNRINATFVSGSDATGGMLRIVIPILVLVFGAMLLAAIVPILTGRRTQQLEAGAPRSYTLGGGICPKCSRPFGFSFFGFNLLGGKYTRCPYCGKWSHVGYASRDKLRAAEEAEVTRATGQVQGAPQEEKLNK